MPAKDKKAIWGPHRLSVGGATPDDASTNATAETLEPVCFHGLPATFYKDVFEAHSVSGICDLTVGGATATEAALALKLPYFGVCPTELHALKTMDFLADRMLAMMTDQTSHFYDPEMVTKHDPTTPKPTPPKPAPMPPFPKDAQCGHETLLVPLTLTPISTKKHHTYLLSGLV